MRPEAVLEDRDRCLSEPCRCLHFFRERVLTWIRHCEEPGQGALPIQSSREEQRLGRGAEMHGRRFHRLDQI
jgi:hypothetical protein